MFIISIFNYISNYLEKTYNIYNDIFNLDYKGYFFNFYKIKKKKTYSDDNFHDLLKQKNELYEQSLSDLIYIYIIE